MTVDSERIFDGTEPCRTCTKAYSWHLVPHDPALRTPDELVLCPYTLDPTGDGWIARTWRLTFGEASHV